MRRLWAKAGLRATGWLGRAACMRHRQRRTRQQNKWMLEQAVTKKSPEHGTDKQASAEMVIQGLWQRSS